MQLAALTRRAVPLAGILLMAGTVSAVADTPTVTYTGCKNVLTGFVRLLPNSLPAPFNACILDGNDGLPQMTYRVPNGSTTTPTSVASIHCSNRFCTPFAQTR